MALVIRRLRSAARRWAALGAALLSSAALATMTAPAAASPHASGTAAAEQPNAAVARGVAITARKAFQAGDYETAVALFRRAYALYPAPTLMVYEARGLERMGHLVEATMAYDQVLKKPLSPDAPHQFVEAVETARVEGQALRARIPRLTLLLTGAPPDDPDVEVTVNGRQISTAQLGQNQSLNPGHYRIEARAGPSRRDHAEVELDAGQSATILLDLDAAPGTAGRASARDGAPSLLPYLFGTAFVVGTGTGVAAGLLATGKHSEANELCQSDCAPGSAGAAAADEFRSLRAFSTVAYGVGAVGAFGSLIWWLMGSSSSERADTASVQPWLSPSSAGIRGRF